MAEPSVPTSSRRTLLACVGAASAAALAGCATYNANSSGIAGGPPAQGSSTPAAPATGNSGAAASTGPAALASTADIPVGGGKILTDKKIVITEPQAGSFKAFTAVCTHQGCIVNTVSGGTINCPCHGSRYTITNGAVVAGPAPAPLPKEQIKIVDGAIVLT